MCCSGPLADPVYVPIWQDAAFTKVLTLNLQRVFTLTQKCLPLLRAAAEQGGTWDGVAYKDPARIVNVSDLLPVAQMSF